MAVAGPAVQYVTIMLVQDACGESCCALTMTLVDSTHGWCHAGGLTPAASGAWEQHLPHHAQDALPAENHAWLLTI